MRHASASARPQFTRATARPRRSLGEGGPESSFSARSPRRQGPDVASPRSQPQDPFTVDQWSVHCSSRFGSHSHGKELAGDRAREAVRRRSGQLRFDGGVSRVRHRHRQGAARASNTASRITWSTSRTRPKSTPPRVTRVRRRRSIRDITRADGCRFSSAARGSTTVPLTRGFFPGPARDSALRDRLEAIAYREGPGAAPSPARAG